MARDFSATAPCIRAGPGRDVGAGCGVSQIQKTISRTFAAMVHGAALGSGNGRDQRALTFPKIRAIGASTMGRAAIQEPMTTTMEATKSQNPVQLSEYTLGSADPCAANMWLRFRNAPVLKTRATCTMMIATK